MHNPPRRRLRCTCDSCTRALGDRLARALGFGAGLIIIIFLLAAKEFLNG